MGFVIMLIVIEPTAILHIIKMNAQEREVVTAVPVGPVLPDFRFKCSL